jgi:hypothetical protein
MVALSGPWLLADASRAALADHGAWIVDLSAPPAVADDLAGRLGRRFISIDDLATDTIGPAGGSSSGSTRSSRDG